MGTIGTVGLNESPPQIHVLHVDDEPGFAEVAATSLERADERIEVDTATSAQDGLDHIAEGAYDCIVSDYDMPRVTGIEFLQSVRQEYPDLPFILYTGKGSEEVASDAISAGATDYLQKNEPGSGQYELLANRIRNAVTTAQSQQAERHLRELAENTDRLLYIFDQDWSELLFINSAYEELWGRSIKALRADPLDFLTGIHSDDRDEVRTAVDRMSSGETIEMEFRVNPDQDFDRWVQFRGEPITDESGDVVRVAGFATDVTDRKELQQKLQKRTERLEEAQRVAGVGSWEWDASSDTVVWSKQTYRIFGWNPEDSTQPTFEDWLQAVHPEDREHAQSAVDQARETRSFPTFEHRLQRPDGETRWVKCRGNVTVDEGGTVRITGTILDITERKRRKREERDESVQFKMMVDAVEEYAIFLLDSEGHVQTWNPGVRQIKGYEEEEIVGEHFSTFYKDADREAGVPERNLKVAAEKGSLEDEGWRVRADGSEFWANVTITALRDDVGELTGFAKVTRDMTDRRDREQALREETAFVESILESQRDLIYAFDSEGKLVRWNDRVVDVTGYTDEELAYMEPMEFVPDDYVERVETALETVLVEGQDVRLEVDLETADGEQLPYEVTATPIRNEGDEIKGLAGIGRDIRERLVREREPEWQNDLLEDFASVVSHDLRNPLMVAKSSLELARSNDDPEGLDRAESALDQMETLISDLLKLARSGRCIDEIEELKLGEEVEAAWETVRTDSATLEADVNGYRIAADQGRLRQLLQNLLSNAVTHGGEEVTIRVGNLEDRDGFYVEDDGSGIPAGEYEAIFEEGYSTAEKGTGFGLSIVRSIAEAHGWSVEMTESRDGGARFEVYTEFDRPSQSGNRKDKSEQKRGDSVSPADFLHSEVDSHIDTTRPVDDWEVASQAHYDPLGNQDLTEVIIGAVAEAEGVSVSRVRSPPLFEVVDISEIETVLFGHQDNPLSESELAVKFYYHDYEVIVEADGRVTVWTSSIETARD